MKRDEGPYPPRYRRDRGNCIEVDAGEQRLVLDVGQPLSTPPGESIEFPPVPSLADGSDPGLLGVVLSHIPLIHHHASGHAGVQDLSRLVEALNPRAVVPIHTFGRHRFPDLFPDVTLRQDGEWFEIRSSRGITK